MTSERKQAEEIGERFEREFSTRSDYFNHRIGLFMEIKEWIVKEAESYASLKLAEATKGMYPKEYVRWIGENEMFRNKGKNGKWFFQTEPYIIWKSDNELFEYWKQNIRK